MGWIERNFPKKELPPPRPMFFFLWSDNTYLSCSTNRARTEACAHQQTYRHGGGTMKNVASKSCFPHSDRRWKRHRSLPMTDDENCKNDGHKEKKSARAQEVQQVCVSLHFYKPRRKCWWGLSPDKE